MKRCPDKNGIALILVLSSLVLISVLVLAVLGAVATFSQSSRAASNNSATRALVDDSVNLVIAQIRDATTLDTTKSWASQPGMIRTYDNHGDQSNLYKLYSSGTMVVDGSQGQYQGLNLLQTELPDARWDQDPAYYTDLNSPVTASDGSTLVFPIIDPRAWSGTANNPPIGGGAWNPNAWTPTTDVQGFTYKAPIDQVALPGGVDDASARLPMPGRWLYVRKNGFITAPEGVPNAAGSVTIPADPSFQDPVANDTNPNPNPIIGRIAFWTDDETCKININTACGDLWSPDTFPTSFQASPQNNFSALLHTPGSFWAAPHFSTWFDEWVLAQPPVRNEFQRYAGHPSTVYLSAVFPEFSATNGSATANGTSVRDELFSIIPRVNGGTATGTGPNTANGNSEGGTKIVTSSFNASAAGQPTYVAEPKHDRLYASTDELLYNAQRTPNVGAIITPKALEKAKFFITADSKAPETNLFNLPRIAMWPIDSTYSSTTPDSVGTRYSAYDQLLAYCCSLGTTNSNYYFFKRSVFSSPSNDWNLGRNPELYTYLQNLLAQNVPGYGGSLGYKYSGTGADGDSHSIRESDQILTEIMDYIRCINLQDPLLATANQYSPNANGSSGVVIPLQNPNNFTMGFGRYITIGEIGLQFIATYPPTATPSPALPSVSPQYTMAQPEQMVAVLLFKNVAVSGGLPTLVAGNMFQIKVIGPGHRAPGSANTLLNNVFSVNGQPLTFSSQANSNYMLGSLPIGYGNNVGDPMYPNTPAGGPYTGGIPGGQNVSSSNTSWGGFNYGGFIGTLSKTNVTPFVPPNIINPVPSAWIAYPYISAPISIGTTTTVPPTFRLGTFTSAASPVTIQIYGASLTAPIQTLSVDFSPLAGLWTTPTYPASVSASNRPGQVGEINGPLAIPPTPNTWGNNASGNICGAQTTWSDSLKTLVPGYPQLKITDEHAGGDYRLVAGLENPPTSFWVAEGGGDPQDSSYSVYKDANPPPPLSHNFTSPLFANYEYPSFYPGYEYGTLINVSPTGIQLNYGNFGGIYDYGMDYVPHAPPSYATSAVPWMTELTHDFDNGPGFFSDGPMINHPEEANLAGLDVASRQSSQPPYFGSNGYNNSAGAGAQAEYTSPNRLVPSPVILGSLPTGIAESMPGGTPSPFNTNYRSNPWQTLLFRAQPEHPGSGGYVRNVGLGTSPINSPPYANTNVPDHLFLDLFWMPVVEPYAISDTFSTSGKINMNYQIMPYTYIDRATAMQAVLRTVEMPAYATRDYGFHKQQRPESHMYSGRNDDDMIDCRYDLNLNTTKGGTLMQFENKFDTGDLFRSASQICDIFLVPMPTAWVGSATGTNWGGSGNSVTGFGQADDSASVATDAYNWWNNTIVLHSYNRLVPNLSGQSPVGFKVTGDNTREEPYANIYSLLTTKSNSYMVHVRVQSLKQTAGPGRDYTQWSDPASGGTDIVTGEYRGSASIERYLDSNDPTLQTTDFALAGAPTLSSFYKYRVTTAKQFAP